MNQISRCKTTCLQITRGVAALWTIALLAAMLIPTPARALPVVEYVSDNFVVYSDAREFRVREMIEELEVFRQIAHLFMGMTPADRQLPAAVYLFSSNDHFDRMGLPADVVGLYRMTSSGPRILFNPFSGVEDIAGSFVVRSRANPLGVSEHQYAHHLLRSNTETPLPYWYEYGLTTLLMLTEIEDHRVTIGSVPFPMEWAYMASRTTSIQDLLTTESLHAMEYDSPGHVTGTAWLLAQLSADRFDSIQGTGSPASHQDLLG